MAKTVYRCSECGEEFPKWSGKCPECGEVATLEETESRKGSTSSYNNGKGFAATIGGKRSDRASIAASGAVATPVSEVIQKKETTKRVKTGINEFDRVLGGGLVPGGVTILAGPPGVGKALDIDTLILTSEGFRRLEDLHVNDEVYAPDGQLTSVIAETQIFEQRPTFYMVMENGETIVADENHEWVVYESLKSSPQVLTSKDIYELSKEGKHFYIKNSSPIASRETNIYPIGARLSTLTPNYNTGESFEITDLLKYDEESRTSLLDSYLNNTSLFAYLQDEYRYFGSVPHKLANKLTALAHSLGIKTEISYLADDTKHDIIIYPRHEVEGKLKGSELPATHPNHFMLIDEIHPGVKTSTKCIEVSHPSHMFLAGKTLIPTHNSSIGLAVAAQLASSQNKKVLYITGEETDTQVAQRALRTGAAETGTELGSNLYLLSEQNLQNCLAQAEVMSPDFILVDSLQALVSENSESSLGSIAQVSEVATAFTRYAKQTNTPTILIGQVTKSDEIAGPRIVEHLVDTVLLFESNSETPLRFLRALKNRYGSTEEIGCFEHTERGLEEVPDPSGFFVNDHEAGSTGYASTVILEGVRPLPLEINALTVPSNLGNPRRVTTGLEQARALTIQAVLSKYVGMQLDSQDVYVATAGGLRLKDTATDLAVAAALMSSYKDVTLPHNYAFIGEVSLTGEIRAPRDLRRRVMELERLGFEKVFCPPFDRKNMKVGNSVTIVETTTLRGFVLALFE